MKNEIFYNADEQNVLNRKIFVLQIVTLHMHTCHNTDRGIQTYDMNIPTSQYPLNLEMMLYIVSFLTRTRGLKILFEFDAKITT